MDKIFYIGYSQGTIQMHYGLAHLESDFHVDNLYRAVHLAPCFYAVSPNSGKAYYDATLFQFQSKGIYAINGPNWDEQLALICENFPGPMCSHYTGYTGY